MKHSLRHLFLSLSPSLSCFTRLSPCYPLLHLSYITSSFPRLTPSDVSVAECHNDMKPRSLPSDTLFCHYLVLPSWRVSNWIISRDVFKWDSGNRNGCVLESNLEGVCVCVRAHLHLWMLVSAFCKLCFFIQYFVKALAIYLIFVLAVIYMNMNVCVCMAVLWSNYLLFRANAGTHTFAHTFSLSHTHQLTHTSAQNECTLIATSFPR